MSGLDLRAKRPHGPDTDSAPPPGQTAPHRELKVLCVFGTRPELIKFLPVLRALDHQQGVTPVTVLTSQHTDLIRPLIQLWNVHIDHDLEAMVHGQSLNSLMARIIQRLDEVLPGLYQYVLIHGTTPAPGSPTSQPGSASAPRWSSTTSRPRRRC